MSGDDFIKSVDDLRDLLAAVSDQVPGLLRGLRDVIYSKEAAENMADAVSTFYKKLVDAGIPKDEALDMARGYVLNLREILGGKGGLNMNIGDFTKSKRGGDED
jgi:hypothetical protein